MTGDAENDWLHRLSPEEWIRAGLGELRRAETAYCRNDPHAAVLSAKRAAGMALNGPLVLSPSLPWGRSYLDHLAAILKDEEVPAAVRDSARRLLEARTPSAEFVSLRSKKADSEVLEAARDVIAHAYARVVRSGGHDRA